MVRTSFESLHCSDSKGDGDRTSGTKHVGVVQSAKAVALIA